jgi:hypothetical protein
LRERQSQGTLHHNGFLSHPAANHRWQSAAEARQNCCYYYRDLYPGPLAPALWTSGRGNLGTCLLDTSKQLPYKMRGMRAASSHEFRQFSGLAGRSSGTNVGSYCGTSITNVGATQTSKRKEKAELPTSCRIGQWHMGAM